jgi:outer membrane protein
LAWAACLPNLSGTAPQNLQHAITGNVTGNRPSGFTVSGSYWLNSSVTLYNGNDINNTIEQANLSLKSASRGMQQENDLTLQLQGLI